MVQLRTRLVVAGIVAVVLFAVSCAPSIRTDRVVGLDADPSEPLVADGTPADDAGSGDLADVADAIEVDAEEQPDQLAFAAPESDVDREPAMPLPPPRPPEGMELAPHLQMYAQGPPRIADGDGADWSVYERSVRDNLAGATNDSPSVADLASFERASLVVCAGDVTPKSAASTFGLDATAERVLNVFAPAMCHLVPTERIGLPGPTIGALDWDTLTQLRWRDGAQWIDFATFEAQARRACLGLDTTVAMAASTAAQIDALLAHGECALAWND